jgi:hypothetical protein
MVFVKNPLILVKDKIEGFLKQKENYNLLMSNVLVEKQCIAFNVIILEMHTI